MLRDAVRGVVVVATGIAEEAGRRVVGAASDLLERSGVDVAAVEKRVTEQMPSSVRSLQVLAAEAVTVGRAGVDLAVGVARGEVERVFERVGDQMVKVGVVLSYLEGKLRAVDENEDEDVAPAPRTAGKPANRADGLFDAGWDDGEPEPAVAEPRPEPVRSDGAVPAEAAPERNGTAAETGTAAANGEPAAKKAPAKRTPAKKSSARPAAAKKTAAGKTAAKKTTAKKTTTRKATAKRTTAQPAAVKKAAVKKTVVKKTVTRRAPKEDGDA